MPGGGPVQEGWAEMKADFHIDTKPVSISFTCPHCEDPIIIPWKDVNAPEYWGDPWDSVTCPGCGKDVELGDYEYD
jgi:endogenous inhibitor of DNA gyrase (YacG/DUF329 family)